MREVKKLTDNRFINLYTVRDDEHHCKAYQFAERLGVDSVAFVCYDRKTNQYLLNREYTPPTNEFLIRAFGGSLDKEKNKVQIVIDEVREEAGFEVEAKDVFYLGKQFVSTQMNQYCHLYIVIVDGEKQLERQPENAIEALAEPVWVDGWEIKEGTDWKSISILSKFEYSDIGEVCQ